jgi:hypothetical protein
MLYSSGQHNTTDKLEMCCRLRQPIESATHYIVSMWSREKILLNDMFVLSV